MSDSYGSGLDFGPGVAPAPITPIDDPATVNGPQDSAPQIAAPQSAPSQAEGPSFGDSLRSVGDGLRNILPGPNYRTPDPKLSALDQSSDMLQQRIERANKIATSPLAQFFAPDQVAAARQFVPQATESLLKMQQQKATIQSGQVQAQTLGLAPGEVSDMASAEDRIIVAQSKALKGDMRAFQGLQSVAPEKAAAIAPQVHEVVAGHLEKAQLAFDSLAGMQNQGQYNAKLNQLRQNGTLTDLESLGMKVPPTFDAFNQVKSAEGKALREARIGIDTIRQKLEERNTYQPMEKKEAETYAGRLTTVYGDKVENGQWGRNGASGTRGLVINGAADPNDLGKKFTLATPEQRKAVKEEFDGALPKTELDKYREFNRTYKLATEDAKGNKFPEGKINTNPNVQQGIAEGLAAMLRGGHGGANVGLLNIETGKRGYMQSFIDGILTNYAGAVNTLSEKDVRPYLTKLTQSQQRDVLDVLKGYNDASIGDRATDIAKRAGALGLDGAIFGLGKTEVAGPISDALEAGRQEQIARMKPNHQAIGGGDGVLQLGAQRPGAGASGLPAGTGNANQLPGAQPLQTPVQQAQQPPNGSPPAPNGQPPVTSQPLPAPNGPPPQPNGAPPAPVRVAGVDVAVPLPAGASPNYTKISQRIETGNERDPWKAGTANSSASGAFQFVKSTWDANKPPGAPSIAKDATPEQQAQAFATLTAKNAAALQKSGVPVNDQNLYMAHNLGAGGATMLLNAPLNADARSIVGEATARNNPLFFKGRPTVATVLGRYQAQVAQDISDDVPRGPAPSSGGEASSKPGLMTRIGLALSGARSEQELQQRNDAEAQSARDLGEGAVNNAPAIGSTIGAVAGGLSPVPGGAVIGGAAGGGAGQALKDYLKGTPQSGAEIAKQAALGGVLSVASAARPVASTAARVVGSGAVEGGAEAAKGADAADVMDKTMEGGAAALGGEAFGRALGMAGHKVFSLFAPDAKKAVQSAAKTYAEATETLRTEAPKITSATGSIDNPKYAAAEAAKTKAEATLKDAGVKPDEAAYAHKVSSEGVPLREAQVNKPAANEQANIGQGYQQLEKEIGDKTRTQKDVKPTPKLADGPIAAVTTGKVSKAHTELAEHVEAAITAPAPDWQTKWTQLKDARSDLLQAERDALTSTAPGRTKTADDMRKLANTVRAQQEKVAEYAFGKTDGAAFMQRLKVLDTRYRNLMEATNNGDLVKAAGLKGEAGRDADRKFRAFAHDDPVALQAWAAMRKSGPDIEKGVHNLVAAERIPVLGKVYSAAKLAGSFSSWMRDRAAGNPASFSDFIKASGDGDARAMRNALGTAVQRGAVQGDLSNNKGQSAQNFSEQRPPAAGYRPEVPDAEWEQQQIREHSHVRAISSIAPDGIPWQTWRRSENVEDYRPTTKRERKHARDEGGGRMMLNGDIVTDDGRKWVKG